MQRAFSILTICLGVLNAILMLLAPSVRDVVDHLLGRIDAPMRPEIGLGIQELLVYFDPLLARVNIPGAISIGFVSLPWLLRKNTSDNSSHRQGTRLLLGFITAMVLIECFVLSLYFVQSCCRGPHWMLYGPFESWDEWKIQPLNKIDLHSVFWIKLLDVPKPVNPFVRELPGLVCLAAYITCGILLAWRIGNTIRERLQLVIAFGILQIAMLIPLKVAANSLLNIKYFVALPEFGLNL